MGGNHKKNLRAEKAKVKLKGAKLPKGLNVTKTEFKVRKITIREQLSKPAIITADGPRQFNTKETLSRLKHHSSNFRLDALRSLREAIGAGQAIPALLNQLHEFVQVVLAAALDVDKETRRESFKALSALLGALPKDAAQPFFHVISSYLCCAMTHIQPQLQEDALLLLDVLLQHTPHLVATHSAKIFNHFLEMISRVRAEGDRAGRTLTVHMGQQQTTIKWRSKVLLRLQQMLHTLAERNRQTATATGDKTISTASCTFNVKNPQHYNVKRSYGAQQFCDISSIFERGTDGGVSTSATDEDAQLRNYIEHLMPLLLDAWLEVRPPEISRGASQVVLSHEAALTLKVVLEIFEDLWCLVAVHEQQVNNDDLSSWYRELYGQAFTQNFLHAAFPYQQLKQTATHKGKKTKKDDNIEDAGGLNCMPQNVNLCYLMCCFQLPLHSNSAKGNYAPLLRYLIDIVTQAQAFTADSYRSLAVALRAYLLQHAFVLLQEHATLLRQLLRATITACLNGQFSSREAGRNNSMASQVLVLLCNIAQNPQLYSAYGEDEFTTLLKHLPQLLLRPSISEATLISMSHLGKQQNTVFLRALEEQVLPVIEHMQRIQVLGACNAFEGKKHIMNLIYWTEHSWRNVQQQQQQLIKAIEQHATDKRIVSYCKYILT